MALPTSQAAPAPSPCPIGANRVDRLIGQQSIGIIEVDGVAIDIGVLVNAAAQPDGISRNEAPGGWIVVTGSVIDDASFIRLPAGVAVLRTLRDGAGELVAPRIKALSPCCC